MTIETKDVVAFSARLRTYQWGIEQDTLNQAADLIQSLIERIAVLEGELLHALDMIVDACRDGTYSVSEFADLRASLTKAD